MIFVWVLLSFLGQSVIIVFMKKRYRTVNDYYREIFGEKIFKLPIDAGFDYGSAQTAVMQYFFQRMEYFGSHA